MNVICVDDEQHALDALKTEIKKTHRLNLLAQFTDPQGALVYIASHGVDLAFLDINMRGEGINGLDIARRIREISPATRVIFTTGYSEYALDAIHMHVSGYLLKPITARDIDCELDALNAPVPSAHTESPLRIQCFGNFEVFRDGVPLKFKRQKCREVFAYLVDRRGTTVTMGELCAVLWPEMPGSLSQRAQLRSIVSDLMKTLRECGAEEAIIKTRGEISVVPEALDCDYYRLLKGDTLAINAYRGEYMTQYEWSELTRGGLSED